MTVDGGLGVLLLRDDRQGWRSRSVVRIWRTGYIIAEQVHCIYLERLQLGLDLEAVSGLAQ